VTSRRAAARTLLLSLLLVLGTLWPAAPTEAAGGGHPAPRAATSSAEAARSADAVGQGPATGSVSRPWQSDHYGWGLRTPRESGRHRPSPTPDAGVPPTGAFLPRWVSVDRPGGQDGRPATRIIGGLRSRGPPQRLV